MCGFSGFYSFDPAHEVNLDLLDKTRRVIQHRGPDEHGVYTHRNVGLAFNRLSIIDPAGGQQPLSNEDGSVWAVCNGEIYNFPELRGELTRRGHRFRSRSDAETIVHAWEEYGESCATHLRGMFAFVVFDQRQEVLFGARDRLGIKPFYYATAPDRLSFASEMKSLLELPGTSREIDVDALIQFLRHRYVIAPRTILRSVRKLSPGHSLRADRSGFRTQCYWELCLDEPRRISEAEACHELEEKLLQVVQSHLASDVPLGVLLSGGLDSSAITAFVAELGRSNTKTFSIGYRSSQSELPYARAVAAHFHTKHHEVELTPALFRDSFSKVVWHLDEPLGDPASVPLFHLCHFARSEVTVALSGEGADEVFGGYSIYRVMGAIEKINRIPAVSLLGSLFEEWAPEGRWRKYGRMLGQPLAKRYGGVSYIFSPEQIGRLLGGGAAMHADGPLQALYEQTRTHSALDRMLFLDLKTWLADDLLLKADRMSMAHSLELRVPFLDHEIVEFAFRLPARMKVRFNSGKHILRRAASRRLPGEILKRNKKGFPVPTEAWFRKDLAGFARESLLSPGGIVDVHIERREAETVLQPKPHPGSSDSLFALLVLDDWYRQFARQTQIPLADRPACALLAPNHASLPRL